MRQLTESVYVSGQIGPDDLQTLAAQGVRSIICNRPDGEQFGQPDANQMAEARCQVASAHVSPERYRTTSAH